MNRSYPRWFVGLALVFAQYGCAADATSVATAIDQAETPIVQSSDPAPVLEQQTAQRSSAMSSMAVGIMGPVPALSVPEEVLGPQPVPWCVAVICDAEICRCIINLLDEPALINLEAENAMELGGWTFERR